MGLITTKTHQQIIAPDNSSHHHPFLPPRSQDVGQGDPDPKTKFTHLLDPAGEGQSGEIPVSLSLSKMPCIVFQI